MTGNPLDPDVEAFIQSCINSVEQLEILLLLKVRRELDVETITAELRTAATSVCKRLDDLARKSLVSRHAKDGLSVYRYDPPLRSHETLNRLAALYATHRVAIINAIFSQPSDMLKDFSEAFRIRDKEKDT